MEKKDKNIEKEETLEASREKIDKQLFSRNITKYGFDLNPAVSFSAGLIIIVFSLFALLNLELANEYVNIINDYIVTSFDWIFILSSSFYIVICLYIAFSRLGNVRIGGIYSEPEFSNFAWYSMLISAGMGIGLIFWAVGEPLFHFEIAPPIFESMHEKHTSLATTFFHWGLHPWAIYALIALALSFFSYNRNLPLSIRSVFYPFFKERVYGTLGDVIDGLAVLSTLIGLATSLGLGTQQINSGLDYMLGIGFNEYIQVALIIIITLFATASVLAGIDKGVKFLAGLNMRLAAILMIIILLLGPTGFILRLFSNSLGLYLNGIVEYSFFIAVEETAWQGDWSIFYLAWWISWSPFVGMFIARISKGRTIRELVLGVMVVPSLLSFLWMSVFGGTAIFINEQGAGGLFEVVENDVPVALFEMINLLNIPLLSEIFRVLLFILVTFLVVVYFITSSDSGSLVVNKITSGGKMDTPAKQRAFWAILEGIVAAVLLLIGGEKALLALQTAVISTGLPFAVVLVAMAFALIKGIEETRKRQKRKRDRRKFEKLIEMHENE
ncbi:BCCT family transporter [Natranaerobius trueperi]|uniref:Glycine/betaine ABC transporter n=1 Tax=Natranaerobius trueperi TaxID=759412 RepID=A0A226BWX7_9FIRM|nr:BCCT family transporter [Natranaerobius trueperi]OWZ82824.1 glycine/betaine ABC transporter [Natranaerobius trueperi]